MQKNLTYRALTIVALILIAFFSLYPPKSWLWDMNFGVFKETPPTLTMGLDLQGGMHLIIQVDSEYIEKLAAKDASINIDDYKRDALQKTLDILRNRVDEFGVAEPSIKKLSDDRIELELPGLRDPDRAKNLVQGQAVLEFRMVHQDNDRLARDLTDAQGNLLPGRVVPENYSLLYEFPRRPDGQFMMEEDGITRRKIPYIISNKVELHGDDLRAADVTMGQDQHKPVIAFKLKPDASETFEKLTDKYRPRNTTDNNRLAIVLDNKVIMAPRINSRIPGGSGIIEGNFTLNEAKDMAIKLRTGSLPVPITIIEEQTVGPSLGADSIQRGIRAAYIGTAAVIIFMICYYLAFGIIADIALVVNILLIFGALALFGATLTLPGIAGIVLTIGMSVDANVIVFERIKEELSLGKRIRSAIDTGFSKAFLTIADANITTIIVAIVLYQYGAGPIRGFAITLIIGVLTSMFTAVFMSKTILIYLTNNPNVKSIPIASPIAKLVEKILPKETALKK